MQKNQQMLEKSIWDLRLRHKVYHIKLWNEMPDDEAKKDAERVSNESMFIKKVELYPGFYQKVKKEMENVDWTQNHIDELTYLILLDALHPDKSTMKNAEVTFKDFRDDIDERMTTRQRRTLIREYYPEVFFTPPESMAPDLKDKRVSPFKSIFQDLPPMDEKEVKMAEEMISFEDFVVKQKITNRNKRLKLNAGLRMVQPEDMISLRKFWKSAKKSLNAIKEKHGEPNEDKYNMQSIIKNRTRELEVFYKFVWNAVAMRWFRKKKKNVQKRLFSKKYPVTYTKEDAVRAVEENLSWFEDPVQVFDLINRGAKAYIEIEKPQIALYLYQEALNQIKSLDDFFQGICRLNLSSCYKFMEKPKKALLELDNALDIWKEIDDQYYLGIGLAYKGEIYQIENQIDEADKAFEKSMDILDSIDIDNEKMARGYLDIADCGARINNQDLEKTALRSAIEELDPSQNTDELFLYLNQRLLDVESGKDSMKAEQEPGKLKHPGEFPWYKPTPDSFVPIHPERESMDEE